MKIPKYWQMFRIFGLAELRARPLLGFIVILIIASNNRNIVLSMVLSLRFWNIQFLGSQELSSSTRIRNLAIRWASIEWWFRWAPLLPKNSNTLEELILSNPYENCTQ